MYGDTRTIDKHEGTWYVINSCKFQGKWYDQYESCLKGDTVPAIIIDRDTDEIITSESYNFIEEDLQDHFESLED